MEDEHIINEGSTVNIEPSWYAQLESEFRSQEFMALKKFLMNEKRDRTVYPESQNIFKAFELTPFNNVKVVVLGQDPYHGPEQAHGLCFSVRKGVPVPPSLRNIFKEMALEFKTDPPKDGDLSHLAEQGVLLLNATLTVRANEAGSHQGKGWERFTDGAIKALNDKKDGLIFLLWGRFAQMKAELIDPEKHYILKAPHPSPLSASRGFIGCGHFKETNDILNAAGRSPIKWMPTDQIECSAK